MIPALRKSHFRIWIVLAVCLPLGVVIAWIGIRPPVTSEVHTTNTIRPFEELIKEKDFSDWKMSLRAKSSPLVQQDSLAEKQEAGNSAKQYQLEIERKRVSTTPSTVIYLSEKEDVDDLSALTLLGTIGPTGIYRFNLGPGKPWPENGAVVIVDGIRKKIIQTLSF